MTDALPSRACDDARLTHVWSARPSARVCDVCVTHDSRVEREAERARARGREGRRRELEVVVEKVERLVDETDRPTRRRHAAQQASKQASKQPPDDGDTLPSVPKAARFRRPRRHAAVCHDDEPRRRPGRRRRANRPPRARGAPPPRAPPRAWGGGSTRTRGAPLRRSLWRRPLRRAAPLPRRTATSPRRATSRGATSPRARRGARLFVCPPTAVRLWGGTVTSLSCSWRGSARASSLRLRQTLSSHRHKVDRSHLPHYVQ